MDNALDNAPSIIEAAAQSTLGILALLILTVGAIAYLFFRESGDRVKVVIFSMIFVGAAGFGLVVLSESSGATAGTRSSEETGPAERDDDGETPPADSDGSADRTTLVEDSDTEATPPPEPPPPDRTQITLTYLGDMYACGLQLQVRIGDRTFTPQNNVFQANDILEGRQSYEIDGIIQCESLGSCEARGSGTLDVVPNASYSVVWQNTEYAVCDVILQRG